MKTKTSKKPAKAPRAKAQHDLGVAHLVVRGEDNFFAIDPKLATFERARFVVISAKKRSTRFIQDALVGVKCSLKRGCFSSQACTSGVLWVA